MGQTKSEVYSSKAIVSLVAFFMIFFWFLYSIGVQLHESNKIEEEIDKIRETNAELQAEIESKKSKVAYLKTPQRIEKEAKTQMGKQLPGEKVIVFVEEELELLPTERVQRVREQQKELPNWQKWQYLFFGDRG